MEAVKYLVYIVGRGLVKPNINKVETIQNWPNQPRNRSEHFWALLAISGNLSSILTPFLHSKIFLSWKLTAIEKLCCGRARNAWPKNEPWILCCAFY